MTDLTTAGRLPQVGDMIAVPWNFAVLTVPTHSRTVDDTMVSQPINALDRLSTRTWARFFSVDAPDVPWTNTQGQPVQVLDVKLRKEFDLFIKCS
jgi:hypothetical protein